MWSLLNTHTLCPQPFTNHTVIADTAVSDVAWNLTTTPWSKDNHMCSTVSPLTAVSHASGDMLGTASTGALLWSNYSATATPTGTVTGIEVWVYVHKKHRDHTVQLRLNGSAVGHNRANQQSSNYHTYGGAGDMWGTSLAFSDMPNLSVCTRFQSGTRPHSDVCFVDSVWLQIHYTA